MKENLKKLKEFYDTYKIIIWISTFFGGTFGYDRLVNFYNVPGRLAADEIRFVETHKRDSIMFVDHVIQDNIKWNKQRERHLIDSMRISILEKQINHKYKPNRYSHER